MYIGKVIEVSNTVISVAINKELETPYIVINSNPVRIAGVGSFLKIENGIYEIVSEKTVLESDKKEISIKIASNRVVACKVIGFFEGNEYKQGSSGETPNIFDNAYTVSDEELLKIYSGTSYSGSISVGKYLYKKDLNFYIDINKFFASHSLIVGNTGSGKSNTLNTIFSELFDNINTNGSYFLFIDTNGEYSKAFTDNKLNKTLDTRNVDKNSIHIPLNLLESEDWRLLLEATEKTQYPIIKSVWNGVVKNIFVKEENANIARYLLDELKKSIIGILNSNTNTTNKLGAITSIKEDFSFMEDKFYSAIENIFDVFNRYAVNGNKFIIAGSTDYYTDYTQTIANEIERYSTTETKDSFTIEDMGFLLNITHLHRTYKFNINENNTSPLIGRFNSNKKDFKTIFLPYKVGEKKNVKECLFESSHILVCDVSRAKKEIRRIMVTFLCAKLYNYAVNFKGNNLSLHLVVDEAHNYLSTQNMDKEDAIAKTCIENFESIIKEGRKFGVFLTMATQRPSDITPTLLSQSHNYVIHKLVNPRDIEIMKNTVPFIDEMSITMLSILSPGQAIFSGTAFNRPNIVQIKFDDSRTKVESDTIRLMNNWRRKKNFDEDSLEIAKRDVQEEHDIAEMIGISPTIASEELECPECGEKYICIQGDYAPYGMCLNCGIQHKLHQCTYCNVEMILDEDVIIDEPMYCEQCYKRLFQV
jgi:hypothetical protein